MTAKEEIGQIVARHNPVPWPAEEWDKLRRIAAQLMHKHDCGPGWTRAERYDNCGACVLGRWVWRMGKDEAPNYAGWARVYLEAGRWPPAPRGALALLAEIRCAEKENPPYFKAILRSLVTAGFYERNGEATCAR